MSDLEFRPGDVGKLVERDGYFVVCCGACGRRQACRATVDRKMARRALGALGWRARRRVWRCGRCRG